MALGGDKVKAFSVIAVGLLLGIGGAFLFLRHAPRGEYDSYKNQPTRERLIPRREGDIFERQDFARYEWAIPFCKGKTVADMASGTGDGGRLLLKNGAAVVDGYDYKPLGQKYLLDLEKQSWTKHYGVIVSFETIEHLGNPDFFLGNVQRTADLLLVSTPYGEPNTGYHNEFHKQNWTLEELKRLIDGRFSCEYKYQSLSSAEIVSTPSLPHGTIVAACTPKIHS
jgi:hypothetical protein